jgi:hypothetical protein
MIFLNNHKDKHLSVDAKEAIACLLAIYMPGIRGKIF